MSQGDYSVCIVCGAPRSGTTLLQAILSSADEANTVVPECTYLAALVSAYDLGLKRFIETQHYFDSAEAYEAYNAKIVGDFVQSSWERFGRPRVLVLKSPAASKVVPSFARLLPDARFVVAVRDPKDVVASRNEVFRKQSPNEVITEEQVRYACSQYVDYYLPLIEATAEIPDRILWLAYDEFAAGQRLNDIEQFLNIRPKLEKLWENAELAFRPEWITDLYHAPLSTNSVGRHEGALSPEHVRVVEEQTAKTYRSLQGILARRPDCVNRQ